MTFYELYPQVIRAKYKNLEEFKENISQDLKKELSELREIGMFSDDEWDDGILNIIKDIEGKYRHGDEIAIYNDLDIIVKNVGSRSIVFFRGNEVICGYLLTMA